MAGLIGKKLGMSNMFDKNGNNVSCTVIEAGPCIVTQVLTKEKSGYEAVQLAFGEKKEKQTTDQLLGHFAKAGTTPKRVIKEFNGFAQELKPGDLVTVDMFTEGEWIDVAGISKGKGFQGVVKRHGFSGVGSRSHGQHDRERAPGSVGGSSFPSRVFKGMRMAGRTGGKRAKMLNLEVLKVMKEKNTLIVKGAVPGHTGAFVYLEK